MYWEPMRMRTLLLQCRVYLQEERSVNTGGDARYLDKPIKRIISTPYYAYLKIAEGCDNRCAYCAIPSIRGRYVSRSEESLLAEAAVLKQKGIQELILTAQDTTRYGMDKGENRFAALLEQIALLGFAWVRVMYTYPSTLGEDVIAVMEKYSNICKYIDMPIQHTEDAMLCAMNRHYRKEDLIRILERMRASKFDWALRTTLMCGFPGETERQHRKMMEFIQKYRFDNLGVFAFSCEEGTAAERLPHQCRRSTASGVVIVLCCCKGSLRIKIISAAKGKFIKLSQRGLMKNSSFGMAERNFLPRRLTGKYIFPAMAFCREIFIMY